MGDESKDHGRCWKVIGIAALSCVAGPVGPIVLGALGAINLLIGSAAAASDKLRRIEERDAERRRIEEEAHKKARRLVEAHRAYEAERLRIIEADFLPGVRRQLLTRARLEYERARRELQG